MPFLPGETMSSRITGGSRTIDLATILLGTGILMYNFIYVLFKIPENTFFMLGFISLFSFTAIYFLSYDKVRKMGRLEILAATIFVYLTYIVGFIAFKIYIFSPLAWSLTATLGLLVMCFVITDRYNFRLNVKTRILAIFLFIYFLTGTLWKIVRNYQNLFGFVWASMLVVLLIYMGASNRNKIKSAINGCRL